MRLLAISDIHINHRENSRLIEECGRHPNDWLIVAGDVGETSDELDRALSHLVGLFGKVFWVPGNHELWTLPTRGDRERGVEKYERLLSVCGRHGVVTPEDPYLVWPPSGGSVRIAPLFLLYDYSFGPPGMTVTEVKEWAVAGGILATDERVLYADPFESREAWCESRCTSTEERLAAASRDAELVLVNHWPLRRDLAVLPLVPRYAPWCGTTRTEDWHLRYRARVVVYGHLHIPGTYRRDGIRFEEVSLGYPREPRRPSRLEDRLRVILDDESAA